jgi:hypothetical protein
MNGLEMIRKAAEETFFEVTAVSPRAGFGDFDREYQKKLSDLRTAGAITCEEWYQSRVATRSLWNHFF